MLHDIIINLQKYLALLLAYGFSVTIAGAAKAWIAKKAGDYTADHAGFLTLDPLVHVDFVGMIVLLMTGFGWGREVPVNMYNIYAPRRTAKILAVFYSSTIVHILIGVAIMLLASGLNVVQALYLGSAVVGKTFAIILQGAMGINIFLAMLRFIQASIDLIFMQVIERHPEYGMYIQLGSLVATLTLLLVLGRQIQMLFGYITLMLSAMILNFFV
ncbi:MAG: hypothetical protein WD055_04320 [Candidatus Dependentiae bacterium]